MPTMPKGQDMKRRVRDKHGVKTKSHFFKSLDLQDVTTAEAAGEGAFTGTKVIGSLGPATHTADVLAKMMGAGMAAARLDLTWGPLDFHMRSLEALNDAMVQSKKLCAVLVDTLGREMMVKRPCQLGEDGWPVHCAPFAVEAGQHITITTRDVEASDTLLPVTYPLLHDMVQPGDNIYLGRYLVCGADSASLYLEVQEVEGQDIICEAKNSAVMDGALTVFHMERSADSLLNLQNTLPLLSDYDKLALEQLGQQFEVDFLCLSYTRTREDVLEAREFLDELGMTNTKILAKLQTRQSLLNFRGILAEADGIILSRGNLGLDVPPEKMAIVQKQLISSCNLLGKPVVITRVLDSMINNPRPTRAEATDIANAVLDGCDAILSGAETLRGNYPVDVVATLAQICRVAERVFDWQSHYEHLMDTAMDIEAALTEKALKKSSKEGDKLHKGLGSVGHSLNGGIKESDPDFETDSLADTSAGVSPAGSYGDMSVLGATAAAMTASASFPHLLSASTGFQHHGLSRLSVGRLNGNIPGRHSGTQSPGLMQKLESLASAAVRAASMTGSELIVVYTNTGRTAQMVAKYRPPMPILTLVVPRLVNDSLHWKLEGRSTARCCQLTRGLLPMLATPGPNGDAVLEGAVLRAASAGLVGPRGHVVVLQQIGEDYALKIMSVDATGRRIQRRNKSYAKNLALRTLSTFGATPCHLGRSTSYTGEDLSEEEDDDPEDDLAVFAADPLGAAPSSLFGEFESELEKAIRMVLEEEAAQAGVNTGKLGLFGKSATTKGVSFDAKKLARQVTAKTKKGIAR